MVTAIYINKLITVGLIFVIMLNLVFAGCVTEDDKDENGEDGESFQAEIILKRTFSLDTTAAIDYTLHLPLPEDKIIDDVTVQKVVSVESDPKYTVDNSRSQPHMLWEDHLDGGKSQDFQIEYHIKTNEMVWDISHETSGTVGDIPIVIHDGNDKNQFLTDAWPVEDYNDDPGIDSDGDGIDDERDVDDNNDGVVDKYRIEPSNPEIQDLLDVILNWAGVSDSGPSSDLNVWRVTDAIYRYLRSSEGVTYSTSAQAQSDYLTYGSLPKWATACYNDGHGDCDDQSILFISLCRAAGVPAWMEFGFLYNNQKEEFGGHGWASVFVPMANGDSKTPEVDVAGSQFFTRNMGKFSEWTDDCKPGQFGTGSEQYTWQSGSLEEHYMIWFYTYSGATPSISTSEDIELVKFEVE